MSRKLRVFYLPNGDGVHGFLVAAPNQKEACRLMRSSVSHFRNYGGRRTDEAALVKIAMSEPGVVFKQKIPSVHPGPQPWLYAYPPPPSGERRRCAMRERCPICKRAHTRHDPACSVPVVK